MTLEMWEVVSNFGQSMVLVYVLIQSLRRIASGTYFEHSVFFCFAIVSWLLSNLYWLAFSILRPGMRMPVAPNMISECAIFLFLAASVSALRFVNPVSTVLEVSAAGVFMAANIALWIRWSGEWIQDIISGGCFAYMLAMVICRLKQSGVMAKRTWIVMSAIAASAVLMQTFVLFTEGTLRHGLDMLSYVLMFGFAAVLVIRCILVLRDGSNPKGAVCLSFLCHVWVLLTMYMSAGGVYVAAMWVCSLSMLIMLHTVAKVVRT